MKPLQKSWIRDADKTTCTGDTGEAVGYSGCRRRSSNPVVKRLHRRRGRLIWSCPRTTINLDINLFWCAYLHVRRFEKNPRIFPYCATYTSRSISGGMPENHQAGARRSERIGRTYLGSTSLRNWRMVFIYWSRSSSMVIWALFSKTTNLEFGNRL